MFCEENWGSEDVLEINAILDPASVQLGYIGEN